ncbi:MAG: AI-2E family transporter [Solirubrobacterales bacterium]
MAQVSRTWRTVVILLVAAATSYFLWRIRAALVPFMLAGILAYIMFPVIAAAERHGIPKPAAVLFLYLGLSGAVFLIAWLLIPGLYIELQDMAGLIPGYMGLAQNMVNEVKSTPLPDPLHAAFQQSLVSLEQHAYQAFTRFLTGLTALLGSIFSLVLAPILAYYFIVDWDRIKNGVLDRIGPARRDQILDVFREIDAVLGGFIQGHCVVCLIVGVASGTAAALIGVRFALIVGIISGIAELLPFFGPILAMVPAILLALYEGPRTALAMAAALLVIQQIESNLLSPKIVGDRTGLHPVMVVLSVMAGAELFGLWGMILAVPAAAVLGVLLRGMIWPMLD